MSAFSFLLKAFQYAEASLAEQSDNINQINVFPVADRDTGSNLFRTIKGVANDLHAANSKRELLETYTQGVFMKASGNSGMMFSMFLSHFSDCLAAATTLDVPSFSHALLTASQKSKKQIDKFVEGTLISYIESVAYEMQSISMHTFSKDGFPLLSDLLLIKLNETTNQNPYLRHTHLVDAGAMGMHYWLKGFLAALCQVPINDTFLQSTEQELSETVCHSNHWEAKPNYQYCVQVTLTISEKEQAQLTNDLAAYGDCNLNLFRKGKSRVHVHTDNTRALFKKIMSYSDVTEVKMDNMMMQYNVSQKHGGIAIVTDSSADIPDALLQKHTIHSIPLIIRQGEQMMLDGLSIDSEALSLRMNSIADYPKTASPPLGVIQDTFSWLSKTHDHVIAISLSAKMSATYQAFKTSADRLPNVSVLDSRKNSGAHGFVVEGIAELIHKGWDVDAILNQAELMIENIDLFVMVNDFDAMVKSGRISKAKGWVANSLKLKPIVGINKKGEGCLLAKTMNTQKQSQKLFDMLKEKNIQKPIKRFRILHANDYTRAKWLDSKVAKQLGFASSGILPVSSVIQLHAGQGALAVAIEQGE